jgi:hypothetical protein
MVMVVGVCHFTAEVNFCGSDVAPLSLSILAAFEQSSFFLE